MTFPDEGYIKFDLKWEKKQAFSHNSLERLISMRDKLYKEGVIGYDKELGVGYGNISERISGTNTFYISATQTGNIVTTHPEHYVKVISAHPETNELNCEGPAKASSESMTHAAIYAALPECNAVIHIHHAELWQNKKLPYTGEKIPYGTPEMAQAVRALVKIMNTEKNNVFLMGGHRDGVISFGTSLENAAEYLHSELSNLKMDQQKRTQ